MSSDSENAVAGGAESFAGRVLGSTLGAFELLGIYVGDRLGWYRRLAVDGPLTSTELAAASGTAERYAREWLELQAASGIVTADHVADARERRYALPPAAAEVLTDATSLNYTAPLARMFAASAKALPRLLDAYRHGGGVSWDELGEDAREAQADGNRPWFERKLGHALASVDELHAVLSREGVRVADIGCGAGWSTIAIARAYPSARVDGYDLDGPAIDMARRHAEEAGVSDRVSFAVTDAVAIGSGDYDAGFIFEALHDMPRPVEVLAAVRGAVRGDGAVVVMDEAVNERFTPNSDEVDRLMYSYSLFICLPDGLSSPDSVGTGTVMRPATLEGYAIEAGFRGLEILPIEGFASFRFYRLVI